MFSRKAGNNVRSFCLQLTKGDFQFVGLPRPTDKILIGLSASFEGHPLLGELGIVGRQEFTRS